MVKFIEIHNKTNGFIEKNFKKIKSPEELSNSIDNIVNNYKNILGYLLEKNQDYHLNTFLRPLQDSYKLHEFLTKEYMYQNLVVIDNPKGLHADTNIVDFFKSSGEYLDKNYVGVSKLCCGYCHKYLEERNYEHRGTHGVCDQEWKMDSPLEEKFKASAKEILELNQLDPPQQHRRLSFDLFEEKIPELFKIKYNLGLVQKKPEFNIENTDTVLEEIFSDTTQVIPEDTYIDPNIKKVIGDTEDDLFC